MGLFGYKGYGFKKDIEDSIFDSERAKEQFRINKKESEQKKGVIINQEPSKTKLFVKGFVNDVKSNMKSNLTKSKGFRVRHRGDFRL